MMKLNSKKYPNISYEKGEDIWLSPDETELGFYFDVEEGFTSDGEKMDIVATALDNVEQLEVLAKEKLRKTLQNQDGEFYEIVLYFMKFHKEELADSLAELLQTENVGDITFTQMVDYLKINRFGCIEGNSNEQTFIMDLSFNPDFTDELMVVYFDVNYNIIDISHES
ncbi:MAG: DUF2004 domain-containing protein [Flavobacteriaceae bacterium]|nr:DUF2004 domain-containing protein [Flavobacteriaceae bacterium]